MLVFLDFDGVLHSCAGAKPFQLSCMQNLASAIAPFDVEIVISSSWREEFTLEILKHKLSSLRKPVIGLTPVIDDPFLKNVRHHEVLKYLNETGQPSRQWVGIDDTRGFYPNNAQVYWTDPLTGFIRADIKPLQSMIRSVGRLHQT